MFWSITICFHYVTPPDGDWDRMTVMNSVTSLTNYQTNFHYSWWRFRNSHSPFLISTLSVGHTVVIAGAEHIYEDTFRLFLPINSWVKHAWWSSKFKEDIFTNSRGVIPDPGWAIGNLGLKYISVYTNAIRSGLFIHIVYVIEKSGAF